MGVDMEAAEMSHSPSPVRSRSKSYSPSPLKSPLKQSPSRSPTDTKREKSRSPRGWSRSRSRSRSRSPSYGSRDRGKERRRVVKDSMEASSVSVTGLTKVVTGSHLEHIFAFYGAISNVVLPVYRKSGENKGKGWIIYRSNASAQKAQEYMDGGQIDGAVISVRQEYMPEENRSRDIRSYNRDHLDRHGRSGSGRY